mgnify:CR=1 FL=1
MFGSSSNKPFVLLKRKPALLVEYTTYSPDERDGTLFIVSQYVMLQTQTILSNPYSLLAQGLSPFAAKKIDFIIRLLTEYLHINAQRIMLISNLQKKRFFFVFLNVICKILAVIKGITMKTYLINIKHC